jgi:DNA recombination-dependent growth factor C
MNYFFSTICGVFLGTNNMAILSSAASITRYRVDGKIKGSITERVAEGLKKNAISEIDDSDNEKIAGWTAFETPFQPSFDGYSFVYGNLFIFSLRIDRKQIPTKLIKKQLTLETSKRLEKTNRRFLSKDEKQTIKEKVVAELTIRIPSTPNLYDVIWDYEKSSVYFFSNLRSANQDLEELFKRSFMLSLIRIVPFTAGDLLSDLTDQERDILLGLSPTHFLN